jgi:hypothetical protein
MERKCLTDDHLNGAQFHRDRIRCPPDPTREIDNNRLTLIELPEAELVIQIEDDEDLITGPSIA